MVIKFYDTMTGKKVEFKPKEEGNCIFMFVVLPLTIILMWGMQELQLFLIL